MSTLNGLQIYDHEPELELTELEGNLIAKNIVFMKICQLPKSRWTALKDKIINVPVKDDDRVCVEQEGRQRIKEQDSLRVRW